MIRGDQGRCKWSHLKLFAILHWEIWDSDFFTCFIFETDVNKFKFFGKNLNIKHLQKKRVEFKFIMPSTRVSDDDR